MIFEYRESKFPYRFAWYLLGLEAPAPLKYEVAHSLKPGNAKYERESSRSIFAILICLQDEQESIEATMGKHLHHQPDIVDWEREKTVAEELVAAGLGVLGGAFSIDLSGPFSRSTLSISTALITWLLESIFASITVQFTQTSKTSRLLQLQSWYRGWEVLGLLEWQGCGRRWNMPGLLLLAGEMEGKAQLGIWRPNADVD